uniref:uL23 n=1 Tax=Paranosema locustae TaxID=235221 RepID=UPI00187D6E60|nr:Chain LX0, uL23 [Paranosema locustae]|eukprot:jgi/Antlo1/2101/351
MEIKRNNPKYTRKAVTQPATGHPADIIRFGACNEKAVRLIENNNTLVFICDKYATKPQIGNAVTRFYKVPVEKVNTARSIKGYKKAYVKLKNEGDALKIANEAGII